MKKEDILDMVHVESDKTLEEAFENFSFDSPAGVMQMVGAYKAFGMIYKLSKHMQAKILIYMKDGKKYKLAGVDTFDEFCKRSGISRRTAYRIIKHAKEFGPDAYKALTDINMREKDLNLLTQAGAQIKEDNGTQMISVAGHTVPIGPESKDELSEIITGLVKDKEKAQKQLKQAEKEIERKGQEVLKAEKERDEVIKPFSGDREDFQKSLEEIQSSFDVITMKIHMHWKRTDDDRQKEQMVRNTIMWLNEAVNEVINEYIRS